MAKTVILGDEYDDDLKRRLLDTLKALGAAELSSDWGMAGSQEVDTLTVELNGEVVTVEAETFIGLSISGPDSLVGEIQRAVAS